jgi:hypothetical protein
VAFAERGHAKKMAERVVRHESSPASGRRL